MGPSCRPQLRPAGECVRSLQGLGGGHFLLPPPPSPRSGLAFPLQICQEPKQDSLPAFLWGCFPPRSGQGLAGGSSRSLPAWGGGRGCLGLGAGVTRGQALERGGNAAFSESSAFLRSNRETLAPSLRAPSLARCSRVPSQGSAGSRGTPGHGGFWGPRWTQTPQRGCPGPCGGAGWEGRGPPRPAVGGRAGGWVGRVCIGAAWFRRGGLAAAWGRVLGAPELRSRRAGRPAWGTAGTEPAQCCGRAPGCLGMGGGRGTPAPGEEGVTGFFSAAGKRPAAWAWRGFGVLWFLPTLARGQAGRRQGAGRCESDGAGRRSRVPADVRGPRGGVWGSPGQTWVQSEGSRDASLGGGWWQRLGWVLLPWPLPPCHVGWGREGCEKTPPSPLRISARGRVGTALPTLGTGLGSAG